MLRLLFGQERSDHVALVTALRSIVTPLLQKHSFLQSDQPHRSGRLI